MNSIQGKSRPVNKRIGKDAEALQFLPSLSLFRQISCFASTSEVGVWNTGILA